MPWQETATIAAQVVTIACVIVIVAINRRTARERDRARAYGDSLRDKLRAAECRLEKRTEPVISVSGTIGGGDDRAALKRYRATIENLHTLGLIPDRYVHTDPFSAVICGSRINHQAIADDVVALETAETVRRGESLRRERDAARNTDQPA